MFDRLDTVRAYETPEGVALQLRIAGPVVRALAWFIDFLIRMVINTVVILVFQLFGGLGTAVILISLFLVEWFYPVFFEIRSGATPGKQTLDLMVIHDNGTPVSWSASVLRNLLRAIDFLPLLYGFGLMSMLLNRDFKRLGDLAAGTLVVYREAAPQRPKLPLVPPKAPPVELSSDEQQTLLELAERSETLSSERCVELAEILSELTGKHGAAALTEVHAYANWLAKGQELK